MIRLCFILLLNALCVQLFADVAVSRELNARRIDSLLNQATSELYKNPDNTIRDIRLALPLIYKTEDPLLEAYALDILGNAYKKKGNVELGFETFYEAYQKCDDKVSPTLLSICVSIADVYRTVQDEKKALQFNLKALECARELEDSSSVALCYNMFGLIYEGSGKLDLAEEYFLKSLALNRQLGNVRNVAVNLSNLCIYKTDYPLRKVALLQEAISLNMSQGMEWSLAENYNNLGLQYYYAGDFRKSEENLAEGMRRAVALNSKILICDNYRYRSWLYAAMGRYDKAYQDQFDMHELEDEILSDRVVRRVETDVAEKLLVNKQKEVLLQQQALSIASLKNQLLIMGIALAVILAVGFVVSFRMKSKKRLQLLEARQRLVEQEKQLVSLQLRQAEYECLHTEQELNYSRGELTDFACFIRSRTELLEGIKALLKEGYSLRAEQLKDHLKKINLYISHYQNKNNELKELVEKVNLVNSDFTDRLIARHPDLSKNEKHLAALLRINLSTKEIASLIDSTPKAINMAIYRLRKKLGIETDEKLSDYMKKM